MHGRLTMVDRWVNGMPNMAAGPRAKFLATQSLTFANQHNQVARAEEYLSNVVNDIDPKPAERFDVNLSSDGAKVSTPWGK